MSTQAATAQRVAERMARDLLDMGAVEHALDDARQQGLEGQLVVHVLSYADSLALAIIDQLREEGAVSPEVLSADKAHQQTHAMPGCLLVVLEARASQDLVAALLPDGCRSDVIGSIRAAKQMGWLMLVVVAAGRVLGVLAHPGAAAAQGSGMSTGAAERERQRRADRSRRLSK
jgi:hypothetical protein